MDDSSSVIVITSDDECKNEENGENTENSTNPGNDDLSFEKDWDNFEVQHTSDANAIIVISDFFLIMELTRLVPFMDGPSTKFHPLNMPDVRIGKIEIVGAVIGVKEHSTYYEYLVEDGTGVLPVYYEKKLFYPDYKKRKQILEKFQKKANSITNTKILDDKAVPKTFHKRRPKLIYPSDASPQSCAVLEHKWWVKTNGGLLGKVIRSSDYVFATGYCGLDFQFGAKPMPDITFEHLCTSKLFFCATKVHCIEEADYNARIQQWYKVMSKKRYKSTDSIHRVS